MRVLCSQKSGSADEFVLSPVSCVPAENRSRIYNIAHIRSQKEDRSEDSIGKMNKWSGVKKKNSDPREGFDTQISCRAHAILPAREHEESGEEGRAERESEKATTTERESKRESETRHRDIGIL